MSHWPFVLWCSCWREIHCDMSMFCTLNSVERFVFVCLIEKRDQPCDGFLLLRPLCHMTVLPVMSPHMLFVQLTALNTHSPCNALQYRSPREGKSLQCFNVKARRKHIFVYNNACKCQDAGTQERGKIILVFLCLPYAVSLQVTSLPVQWKMVKQEAYLKTKGFFFFLFGLVWFTPFSIFV